MSIPAIKAASTTPVWHIILSEFWKGFSQPSRVAAGAMVVGFISTLMFTLWFFSLTTLAGPMGNYLPRSAKDAAGFATVKAIRLSRNGINTPTILALGSSTTAQALASGEHIRHRIQMQTGQSWQFVSFATPQQSPMDQLALLETALRGHDPAGPPLIILLSASGLRMGWTAPRMRDRQFIGRIGLRSSWVTDEFERLGQKSARKTGIYAFDNFDFVCLNGTEALMRLILGKPAKQQIAVFANGAPKTDEMRAITSLGERYLESMSNATNYFDFQKRLIDRLRASDNIYVVLIDETIAPDALDILDLTDTSQKTVTAIQEFALENRVEYWTPVADAKLGPDDFHDTLHVSTGEPQKRIQRELTGYLLNYIGRMGL